MPRATQDTAMLHIASCTQLSCSMAELSRTFHSRYFLQRRGPTTPVRPEPHWFGLIPGRSPLLGESRLFSFPPGTKMFQFPGLAPLCGGWSSTSRVVPFGDPRVKGHLHLTAAFRSLSRPSSPVRAKASAIRPFLLSFARYASRLFITKCHERRFVYFQLYL